MRFSISGKLCLLSTGLNIALTSSPQRKTPPPKGRAEFVPAVPPWFPDANRDALSGARLWLRQTNQQPLGALDLSPEGHFPHARRSEAAYAPAFANGGFRPSLLRRATLRHAQDRPEGRPYASIPFGRRLGRDFRALVPCPLAPSGTRWPAVGAVLVSVFAFVFGCANQSSGRP